jgi:RNA polymerase-binding transcription factor DksA
MATAKPKKKKSGSAKKPVPTLKKKKVAKGPAKKAVPKKVSPKKEKPMIKAVSPVGVMAVPKVKDEKEETRKTLLDMREKLLAGISENPIPEALATQSDIGDIIDQAGDERDRELSLLLSGRDKEKLLAINEALEKLKEGTYGICEECGERIGHAPGEIRCLLPGEIGERDAPPEKGGRGPYPPGVGLLLHIGRRRGLTLFPLEKKAASRVWRDAAFFHGARSVDLLDDLDVLGLGAFGGVFDFEADFLAFRQGLKAVTLDCSVMDE